MSDCSTYTAEPLYASPIGDVTILPTIEGGTQLSWKRPKGLVSGSAINYRLEYSTTGSPTGEWHLIGTTGGTDAIDATRRIWSARDRLHYRITVNIDGEAAWTSDPIPRSRGYLTPQRRSQLFEAHRRWRQRSRLGELQKGHLLKRIYSGVPCPDCRDRDSGRPLRSGCLTCFDTAWTDGYDLNKNVYAEIGVTGERRSRDPQRGPVTDTMSPKALFLNLPSIDSKDVWIDTDTDERWLIGTVIHRARIGGCPILVEAELSLLPTTHVLYQYDTSPE